MDFQRFNEHRAALLEHPGKRTPSNRRPTAEDSDAYHVLVGQFLDELALLHTGDPHTSEDLEEVQNFFDQYKDEEATLRNWDTMHPNAKITVAMRITLALDRVTFEPEHPAVKQGWDVVADYQDLIIGIDLKKFPHRAA